MIYIAGPFFTPDQLRVIKEIEDGLREQGARFFSPRMFGIIQDMTPEEKRARMLEVYQENVKNLNDCDSMIAVIDGFDTGTIFEIGWFAGHGKDIVTLSTEGHGLNLMLRFPVMAHVSSVDDATAAVTGQVFKAWSPEVVQ